MCTSPPLKLCKNSYTCSYCAGVILPQNLDNNFGLFMDNMITFFGYFLSNAITKRFFSPEADR